MNGPYRTAATPTAAAPKRNFIREGQERRVTFETTGTDVWRIKEPWWRWLWHGRRFVELPKGTRLVRIERVNSVGGWDSAGYDWPREGE